MSDDTNAPASRAPLPDLIADPSAPAERARWDKQRKEFVVDKGEQVVVARSTRDDPLAGLKARGAIHEAEYLAGRHWQQAQELVEVGSVKAMDPGKEAVDGGVGGDRFGEIQHRAHADLQKIRKALGAVGYDLVVDVLGNRMTIAQAAEMRGKSGQLALKVLGARLRECLETMAEEFGYASRGYYRQKRAKKGV